MMLVFYFLFVVVAIGGIALLLNRLGQGQEAAYTEEEALRHLQTTEPGVVVREIRTAGHARLFALEGGRLAIVRPMGRFPLVKILAREDIEAMDAIPGGLRLRTTDFADPSVRLQAEDGTVLRDWIERHLELAENS